MFPLMPAATPARKKSHPVVVAFLVLYVLFLGACGFLCTLGWSGLGSYGKGLVAVASVAAGLPWSVLLLFIGLACDACTNALSEAAFVAIFWLGALVNLVLLARAAGLDRLAADALRAAIPRTQPRLPQERWRSRLARMPAMLARHFDEVRERRGTGLVILSITLLLGFASVLELLGAAQSGASLSSPDIRWSSGMLFALAGTWCRQLSTNAQLRASAMRFGFAAAGTAWGTLLAAWSAVGWAASVLPWSVLYSVFAAWQLWLLAATLGSRGAAPLAVAARTPEA
jgi:hypothetical protein